MELVEEITMSWIVGLALVFGIMNFLFLLLLCVVAFIGAKRASNREQILIDDTKRWAKVLEFGRENGRSDSSGRPN